MNVCKEAKWLCENSKVLEKHSGKWVVFSSKLGLLAYDDSFDRALNFKRAKKAEPEFVFHVPSREELQSPTPIVAKK